jgi:hypothetical protein
MIPSPASRRLMNDRSALGDLGLLPNGTINIVKIDDPPFTPEVYDRDGRTVRDPYGNGPRVELRS